MRVNQKVFIFLLAFFVIVAFGSLLFLDGSGSVFDRTKDSVGAETAVLSQTIIGEEDSSDLNESVAKIAEESKEVVEEPEIAEEPVVEEPVVEEPVVEEPAVEEEAVQEEPVEEEPSLRYFTFETNTQTANLRLREKPLLDSTVVSKLKKGSKGYVLKPGNQWCKVVTEYGLEGYCSTEYLILTEVTAEDFPEEHVEKVEPADEELGAAFGN